MNRYELCDEVLFSANLLRDRIVIDEDTTTARREIERLQELLGQLDADYGVASGRP